MKFDMEVLPGKSVAQALWKWEGDNSKQLRLWSIIDRTQGAHLFKNSFFIILLSTAIYFSTWILTCRKHCMKILLNRLKPEKKKLCDCYRYRYIFCLISLSKWYNRLFNGQVFKMSNCAGPESGCCRGCVEEIFRLLCLCRCLLSPSFPPSILFIWSALWNQGFQMLRLSSGPIKDEYLAQGQNAGCRESKRELYD